MSISGEVLYPGRYAIKEGETVKDVIRKAGGLTKEAFQKLRHSFVKAKVVCSSQ